MTSKDRDESEPKFKVVDRRRFDDRGNFRSDEEEEEVKKVEPVKAAPPVPQQEEGGIDFSMFVQSLAQQVLMALGLMPWPDSGLVQARMEQAKETIEILAMLREKTKGNLTAAEQRLFDTLLYELRVAFMQVLQGGAKGPKGPGLNTPPQF